MRDFSQVITQREADERIAELMEPKWEGSGCAYCGDPEGMCYPSEGEPFPCPNCDSMKPML